MTPKLKYKLNILFQNLPRSVKGRTIWERLAKHGISKSTFYRHCRIKSTSPVSIGLDDLEIYAQLFDVTIDELKNYEAPKIKPLTERAIKPLSKKLGIKTK